MEKYYVGPADHALHAQCHRFFSMQMADHSGIVCMVVRMWDRYLLDHYRWNIQDDPAYENPFFSTHCIETPTQEIVSYAENCRRERSLLGL